MTIRTTPPGAMVYIDDYPIGTTPISHDFTYYGTRKIRLVKDGYETKTILQPVPPPWYEYVPLDFISENLVPGQIRDHHTFDYQLEPQLIVPPQQLTERAELLRANAVLQRGSAVSANASRPRGGSPVQPVTTGHGPHQPPTKQFSASPDTRAAGRTTPIDATSIVTTRGGQRMAAGTIVDPASKP